ASFLSIFPSHRRHWLGLLADSPGPGSPGVPVASGPRALRERQARWRSIVCLARAGCDRGSRSDLSRSPHSPIRPQLAAMWTLRAARSLLDGGAPPARTDQGESPAAQAQLVPAASHFAFHQRAEQPAQGGHPIESYTPPVGNPVSYEYDLDGHVDLIDFGLDGFGQPAQVDFLWDGPT